MHDRTQNDLDKRLRKLEESAIHYRKASNGDDMLTWRGQNLNLGQSFTGAAARESEGPEPSRDEEIAALKVRVRELERQLNVLLGGSDGELPG